MPWDDATLRGLVGNEGMGELMVDFSSDPRFCPATSSAVGPHTVPPADDASNALTSVCLSCRQPLIIDPRTGAWRTR